MIFSRAATTDLQAPAMLSLVRISLLLLVTPFAFAAEVELVRIWPGWRDAATWDSIPEYFGGPETHGSQVVLRTQPATRDGFYFLVRAAATTARNAVRFELEIVRPDSPEPKRHAFSTRLPAGETVFQLGVTGADWPDGKRAQPVAWRIILRGPDNSVLAEHKSFLWEQPARK
jgi:hypothetical protein